MRRAFVTLLLLAQQTDGASPLRPPGLSVAALRLHRGGGPMFPDDASPFDVLRGRKVAKTWSGDCVDLVEMACLGLVAGSASRVVLKIASGVAANVAAGCIVVYALHYSGFLTINAEKLAGVTAALPDLSFLKGLSENRAVLEDELKRRAADFANANEHRALGGVGGLAASYFLL